MTAALRHQYAHALPHFLLIGAQKCGTSSLHHVLAHHPDVFMPPGEVFFFDVDDQRQHPDFFPGGAHAPEWAEHLDTYLAWYAQHFARASTGQLRGEDSTTYLASTLAPERVATLLPEAKCIVMLRNPVDRAWSHYWHGVAAGRVTASFEDLLENNPGNLLQRGEYAAQLGRWRQHVAADRTLVLLFDDWKANPQAVIDRTCAFLGLHGTVDLRTVDSHRNRSIPPLSMPARLFANRALSPLRKRRYFGRVPFTPGFSGYSPAQVTTHPAALAAWDMLQAIRPKPPVPQMRPATRALLHTYFQEANRGLGEAIGEDVASRWGGIG